MDLTGIKYLVVGAGLFGSVIADRIARDKNKKVAVIEKKPHIGGNCFSDIDKETGIEYHVYGTHIFHTSSEKVWSYISEFTKFNGYRHQVLTMYRDKVYQMPINLETINMFYGLNLKPFEVQAFLDAEIKKENIKNPQNLEEKAVSQIGRPLYEAFIKGYTEKQWQKDCKQLPMSIIARLPVRKNYDESYYFDFWQGIPLDGYTEIFQRMLSHKNIDLYLNMDFFETRDRIPPSCLIIYSGPIDRFFNYKFNRLEWRTLEFEKEVINVEDYQGTSVMNYAERTVPYTRIHEPKHLHPEKAYTNKKTLIIKEYPQLDAGANPYYPVNTPENQKILQRYLDEREKHPDVIFGGRLGDYKYYDMDKTIETALDIYESKIKSRKA
jgi:UDP-galactopyranose mutase